MVFLTRQLITIPEEYTNSRFSPISNLCSSFEWLRKFCGVKFGFSRYVSSGVFTYQITANTSLRSVSTALSIPSTNIGILGIYIWSVRIYNLWICICIHSMSVY